LTSPRRRQRAPFGLSPSPVKAVGQFERRLENGRFLTPEAKRQVLVAGMKPVGQDSLAWALPTRTFSPSVTDNAIPGVCTLQSCAGHVENGYLRGGHLWRWLDGPMSARFNRRALCEAVGRSLMASKCLVQLRPRLWQDTRCRVRQAWALCSEYRNPPPAGRSASSSSHGASAMPPTTSCGDTRACCPLWLGTCSKVGDSRTPASCYH
jgi:hypothetical protein